MGAVMSVPGRCALAQTNVTDSAPKSVVIESTQGAEWDFNSGLAVFRGNVKVTDAPTMVIECDLLTAHFGATTTSTNTALGSVDSIVAEQNVVIDFVTTQGKRHATGDKAVYSAATDVVELSGNPIVTIPQGRITGPVIILDRKNNKFRVPGSFKFVSSSNVAAQPFFPPTIKPK